MLYGVLCCALCCVAHCVVLAILVVLMLMYQRLRDVYGFLYIVSA